jgi:hypothetical protein
VLAGRNRADRRGVVAVVGRRNAHEVNAARQQLVERIVSRETDKIRNRIARGMLVGARARARPRRGGGEHHLDHPEVPSIEALRMEPLEHRPVGFLEDHPHADHARPQAVRPCSRGPQEVSLYRRRNSGQSVHSNLLVTSCATASPSKGCTDVKDGNSQGRADHIGELRL